MLKIIKRLFTEWRSKKTKKSVEEAISILRRFDVQMKRAGLSRQERRFFWREFGQNEEQRDEILRKLSAKLGIDWL